MTNKRFTRADLAQFTGSEQWFRHGLVRKILYTEGARFLAENAGAYWLLDEIAFAQANPAIAAEEFQFWKLQINQERAATLTCEDGNGAAIYTKKIEFTDFPFQEFSLYCASNVILLPSEY